MVDLRLESVYGGHLPPDFFVSVRVGEAQKLSQLRDVRTYHFPTACSNQRVGRIEVYKRVGMSSIDVDPSNSSARDVQISCGGELGTLGFRAHLEVDQLTRDKIKQEAATKKGTKVKAAQEYLGKHGLESLLSQTMFDVLRERPDDPLDFIIGQLNRKRQQKAEQPSPEVKGAVDVRAAPVAKLGEAGYYSQNVLPSVGAGAWSALYERFPLASKPAADAHAVSVAKLGEAGYYSQNVLPSVGAGAWSALYERFPLASKPAADAHGVSVAKLGEAGYYSQSVLPSVGAEAWSALYERFPRTSKPAPAPAQGKTGAEHVPKPGEAAYYNQNVLPAVGPEAWSALHDRFPAAKKTTKAAATVTASAAAALLKTLPSVGTWLAHRRRLPGPVNSVVPQLSAASYSVHKITEFNRAEWEALEYVAPM